MRYNKDIDWADIHLRFINGETIYAIAKSLKGQISKQAIMYRQQKEGWVKADRVEQEFPVKVGNEVLDLKDERKALIVQALSEGKTLKVASAKGGISDDTLKRWRDADAEFESIVVRARALQLGCHEDTLSKASERGDWKAAAYILERDPITKEHYHQRDQQVGTAIQINVGIDRNEVKIK